MDSSFSADDVQRTNWNGLIPIQLSLAPTSLSSPTMPPPSHRLISRQSYLHVALENDVRKFHEFAPVSVTCFRSTSVGDVSNGEHGNSDGGQTSNGSEVKGRESKVEEEEEEKSYPICWFEDEVTGIALRWQVFIGVLFDLLRMKQVQGQEGFEIGMVPDVSILPWKIRIHFTAYPATLLPIGQTPSNKNEYGSDTKQCIFQYYLNSLKQSLYIQHNSNKVSKNMSKQSHLQLWDGITRNQWEVYRSVASELNESMNPTTNSEDSQTSSSISASSFCSSVPIRILVDDRPVFSRPCPPYRSKKKINDGEGNDNEVELTTLQNVLQEWLPDHRFGSCTNDHGDISDYPNVREALYLIQGAKIPLECHVVDLWRALCHPDRFLYVAVVTK